LQGPPGDVSTQQLTDASVGPYTGDFSDPPTADQLRSFLDWANNLFAASAR